MRIGIYVNTLPTTSFVNRLIGNLVAANHHVLVFGTQVTKHNEQHGAKYFVFKLFSFLNYSKFFFFTKYVLLLSLFKPRQKRQLDALLLAEGAYTKHNQTRFYPILWHRPEVLHVQWVMGIAQFLWVQEFGIKLIASLRGTNIYVNPLTDKGVEEDYQNAFPRLQGVHAVCQDIAQVAAIYGLEESRVQVIYSGIDIPMFPFVLPSQKEPRNTLQLLSVGRQSWVKGFQYALDALAQLKSENIPFHYTVVGGAASEELLFQVHQLELTEEVTFTAALPFTEVQRKMQEVDMLIVPSVSEGIANVAIEAMALGTAVVVSDCGGMSELVADGVTGYLVPVRQPAAIVAALQRWSQLPPHQKDALALAARDKVITHFNSTLSTQKFTELYQRS